MKCIWWRVLYILVDYEYTYNEMKINCNRKPMPITCNHHQHLFCNSFFTPRPNEFKLWHWKSTRQAGLSRATLGMIICWLLKCVVQGVPWELTKSFGLLHRAGSIPGPIIRGGKFTDARTFRYSMVTINTNDFLNCFFIWPQFH